MALYIPHSIFHLARLLYVRPETFGPYYVWAGQSGDRITIGVRFPEPIQIPHHLIYSGLPVFILGVKRPWRDVNHLIRLASTALCLHGRLRGELCFAFSLLCGDRVKLILQPHFDQFVFGERTVVIL